jgi:hypothetical protein
MAMAAVHGAVQARSEKRKRDQLIDRSTNMTDHALDRFVIATDCSAFNGTFVT